MQIGVKCPRGLITHDECRRCSADPLRPCGLSPDMLEMIRLRPDDRHADPDAFSPTGLLDCDRKAVLTAGSDWYVDIEHAYPMLRGNLVHGLIEMDADRYPGAVGVIRETEMETTVETRYGPQRFVGKPDLVVVQALREGQATIKIVDYKSTSEIGHDLTAAKADHVRQINMYAWLAKRWLAAHYTGALTVEIGELEIIYLDFKKVRRFTSAGPLTARGKRLSVSPLRYAVLDLSPIHLFSDAIVEQGVQRMIEAKLAARETLPPAYTEDDENYWKCRLCPVRQQCEERG